MALTNEGKLQDNVAFIKALLEKQISCCNDVVAASWMHDQSDVDVYVLVHSDGTVVVKDSPTGAIQTSPDLPLKP